MHRHGHVAELLFTFGVAFVIDQAVQLVWGRLPVDYRIPTTLDMPAITLFGIAYPAYRLFMLAISVCVFLGLLMAVTRSRTGLVIRAALTHPGMTAMLGHNVPAIFTLVFGAGCALAGLAGVIAGPALVTQPSMAATLGPILFVVVVMGGLGSLSGCLVASLAIGLLQTFSVAMDFSLNDLAAWIPLDKASHNWLAGLADVTLARLAPLVPYLLLVLLLVFRSTGLMGNREI